jgi:preprotein translocase subunit SecF
VLDFVGKRYWYFLFSALIIIPGIISLLIPPALKPGIEFSSGSSMTIGFEATVDQADLRQELENLGHADAIIQRTGEGDFLIRTRALRTEVRDEGGNIVEPSEREELENALRNKFGPLTVRSFDYVSPVIAAGIVRNAILAVTLASVGILLYITWAFRKLPSPFRYGVCAIVALVHDALVIVGLFSIFGKLFNIEVDSMFITGVLTIIGYSVHDTIVVFDRIRDNLTKGVSRSFEVTVNRSILETLGRSLTTGLAVLFTLLALYLFGGVTIHNFILVLLIGVVSGTYSSIFNASQLLVVWQNNDIGKLIQRLRPVPVATKPRS